MSVIKQHRSSFDRMVFESVLIFRDGENVLNSKSEFSRCQVPRLSVMIGDNQKYDNVEKDKEVTKLKRRLIDDNHNCKPPKRRRKHVDAFETKKDDLEAIEISETSQKAVDEHQSDVAQDATNLKTFPIFDLNQTHKQKPNLPSKRRSKNIKRGEPSTQTKLFDFFLKTDDRKPISENFTKPSPNLASFRQIILVCSDTDRLLTCLTIYIIILD